MIDKKKIDHILNQLYWSLDYSYFVETYMWTKY